MLRVPARMERSRVEYAGMRGDHANGAFIMPDGMVVIVSSSGGWDHVSASYADRCPTWDEMDALKRTFFAPEDTVMQLHVPASAHISCHPYCLHLWRPQFCEIPRPPSVMVA